MDKRYNLSNLQAQFTDFLIAENISAVTLKNYRSDIKHFFGWSAKFGSSSDINSITSLDRVLEYKAYLIDNETPLKTLNRRLSAIRKFCSFCISQGWMKENPAKKVLNHRHGANLDPRIREDDKQCRNDILREDDKLSENDNNLSEFKADFPTDFENLSDYFQIINYPQTQGK